MSAVAVIPTDAAVDAAWDRFQALARPLIDNPALLSDRLHMEALARAEAEWKRAFLAIEGA